MKIETYLAIGAGLAAFISAALWVIAARARVPHDPEPQPDQDGMLPFTMSVDGDDFIATVQRQGELNRWAAYVAAVAASMQGMSVIVAALSA